MTSECRLERLSAPQVDQRLAEASVAYVPIGSIEFHGPHLPVGVDMFTAHGLCIAAARRSGGVVLPPSYLANGCLDLPHTLTFEPSIVEAWTRAVVQQLHHRGVGVVVLVTGHGPLDLVHLLKRVAGEVDRPGARCYGLCWLELNAARLQGPETGEPTVIDHASTVETSWMMALEPELVHLDRLPEDPAGATVGVYGVNPRATATSELGVSQLAACADLLALRAGRLEEGTWQDAGQDLARFVEYAWPEPLTMVARRGPGEAMTLWLSNPGRASRYISRIQSIQLDGSSLGLDSAWCANSSMGETGVQIEVGGLSRERGVYVRRGQALQILLPHADDVPVGGCVEVDVELGGVSRARLLAIVADEAVGHDSVDNLDDGLAEP